MKRKLAWFGLAFATAELFAAYLPPLVLLPAAAFFALLAFLYHRYAVGIPFAGIFCGLLCFFVFYLAVVRPLEPYAGQTAQCTVIVETDDEPAYQEGMYRGSLRVTSWNGEPTNFLVECRAFPAAAPGDTFTAQWKFADLETDAYQMSYRSQGIHLQAEYLGSYQPQPSCQATRFTWFRLRKTLAQRLKTWMTAEEGELEAAMLLGDKTGLRDTIQDTFRIAGVSHLLAVSGLHVALLCGIFSFGFRRRFVRPLIVLRAFLVIFYMLLTGLPVSVLRAGLVFLIALAGDFFLQPVDLLTSTGAAAVLLGLQNAYAPCDLGFQLSFCAVLGVQAAGTLSRWEEGHLPDPRHPWAVHILSRGMALLENVQIAFLAGLATLPVLIAHGMTASGVGVLTNLLVVWMLEPALQLGIVILVLQFLPGCLPVVRIASVLLSLWLRGMLSLVGWCAGLPLAQLALPKNYTLLVLAVLGILALVFHMADRMLWYLPAAAICSLSAIAMGIWSQENLVRIALVGTANNPCAVCMQNGQAVILFRGGQSNVRAVTQYLAENADPEVTLVVDLRQDPSLLNFGEWPVTEIRDLEGYTQQTALDDVALDLYHDGSGSLAVLGVGNRHIALASGRVHLDAPVSVDVFCAGSSLPDTVLPQTIVCCTDSADWLTSVSAQTVLYGQETPVIMIRPWLSLTYEEVEPLALQ